MLSGHRILHHRPQAIYSEARQRGLAARKVDVLYSASNDISKPWGFLWLACVIRCWFGRLELRCKVALPRLALGYVRRLRQRGLVVLSPVCFSAAIIARLPWLASIWVLIQTQVRTRPGTLYTQGVSIVLQIPCREEV